MINTKMNQSIKQEAAQAYAYQQEGKTNQEIADIMGVSIRTAQRRVRSHKIRLNTDPTLVDRLENQCGIVDYGSLHSGWLKEKNEDGNGSSLYFILDKEEEAKLTFADAIRDVLNDIKPLKKIKKPKHLEDKKELANWIMIADLHIGGNYGTDEIQADFEQCIDDLVARLPKADTAVLMELGDILDANDHKGMTPHSGNVLDVRREDVLKNTVVAIAMFTRAIIRLLETHTNVEVHMIRGNHDETAYIAVLLALEAAFRNNPRVKIVVTDAEFRVISWGTSACFPHHGDKAKWPMLKDVWADQFADEWAQAKMHRLIATAHLHHDRKIDMQGAVGEQFRTISRPSKWAESRGFFSRGTLTGLTIHKELGEIGRTNANIIPTTMSERYAEKD